MVFRTKAMRDATTTRGHADFANAAVRGDDRHREEVANQ